MKYEIVEKCEGKLPIHIVSNRSFNELEMLAEDLECVKFNVSQEEIANISDAVFVDVLGSLGINSWYNFGTKETIKSKQVLIKDIEVY